jgi:serine/threonine protein kinase
MLGMMRKNSMFEHAVVTSSGSIKVCDGFGPSIASTDGTRSMQTKKIRNYRVKKAIGQGAFGRIKLGQHEATGKEVCRLVVPAVFTTQSCVQVALKMMSKDRVKSMQTLKREIQVFQVCARGHAVTDGHVAQPLHVGDRFAGTASSECH